mgnify:FL=1
MKLLKIVKKDLKLFMRDKRSLALTVIAPIVILLILGNIFGQSSTSKSISGITLGVCNLDEKSFDLDLPLFNTKILEKDCALTARSAVSEGKLRASVVIPKNFSADIENGEGAEILLFVDNSKTQAALFSSDAMKAVVQDLNENIGTEFIGNAWIRLNKLNEKLKIILPELETARDSALETQMELNEINNQISKIDEEKLEKIIDSLNGTIPYLKLNLSYVLSTEIDYVSNLTLSVCSSNSSYCPALLNTSYALQNFSKDLKLKEESINSLDIGSLSDQVA